MSEEGRFGKGGANGVGGGVFGSPTSPVGGPLSRDGSSTSLMKGSETRQLITFREEGKPSVVYRLGNCIGKGQFGTVYRALNLGNGSMHAIKRIRLEGLQEDDITQLMKEVELLKRLAHPSIVKYEGMMRDEDTLNIILEYIENGSLGSTLKSFGDLTEHLVSSYVMKILEGLHYLHTQRVVHCDLKAANILTTKSGNVKLSDFGVSLNLVAVEHKKENDVAGTPNWMAPEVIQMEGASTASDIWSLGCTVIELLTGKPPFAEIHNGMAVMYRIVEGGPPPFPENASPELKSFLSQCFEKDPTMRPSADVLFEHDWVKPHLALNKVSRLRPQDSIPFLRRVSADMENLKDKEALSRASLPPPERPFERSYSSPTPIASPTRSPEVPGLPSPVKIPSRASESTLVGGRQSQETTRRPATLLHSVTMPIPIPASEVQDLEYDRPMQEHRFVKSTFSKGAFEEPKAQGRSRFED
ncbi:kinase-like domain-containing protein [Mrakia frigida]|uniref:serine/threonine-protein kinase n=1 Tax=Mrakia frigida TaxID=29902 RepID=UPI003FCC06E6